MHEQQLKQLLEDDFTVRLSLHDIIELHSDVQNSISRMQDKVKNNPSKSVLNDYILEKKRLLKKLEDIWDRMAKKPMTANEYLERFKEVE